MDNILFPIFQIAVLVFSAVIHEVSHGYAALAMGDQTAKFFGRLTLNPLKHLDPFGSVILPLLLVLLPGNFIFAYAKPVPFNPRNLRDQKYGSAKVALAGPASNLAVALLLGIIIRAGAFLAPAVFSGIFLELLVVIVFINVLLAMFNLVPIPPLDGSKILFALLPVRYRNVEYFLQQWGTVLLLLLLLSGVLFYLIYPAIFFFVRVFTGIGF